MTATNVHPHSAPTTTPASVVVLTMTDPNGDAAASHALLDQLTTNRLAAEVRVVELGAHPAAAVTNWRGVDLAVVVRLSHRGLHPVGTIERTEIIPSLRDAELVAGYMADAVALGRAVRHLPRKLELFTIEAGNAAAERYLSPELARGVDRAVAEIMALIDRKA